MLKPSVKFYCDKCGKDMTAEVNALLEEISSSVQVARPDATAEDLKWYRGRFLLLIATDPGFYCGACAAASGEALKDVFSPLTLIRGGKSEPPQGAMD